MHWQCKNHWPWTISTEPWIWWTTQLACSELFVILTAQCVFAGQEWCCRLLCMSCGHGEGHEGVQSTVCLHGAWPNKKTCGECFKAAECFFCSGNKIRWAKQETYLRMSSVYTIWWLRNTVPSVRCADFLQVVNAVMRKSRTDSQTRLFPASACPQETGRKVAPTLTFFLFFCTCKLCLAGLSIVIFTF